MLNFRKLMFYFIAFILFLKYALYYVAKRSNIMVSLLEKVMFDKLEIKISSLNKNTLASQCLTNKEIIAFLRNFPLF